MKMKGLIVLPHKCIADATVVMIVMATMIEMTVSKRQILMMFLL